jgi:transcriptional regulator
MHPNPAFHTVDAARNLAFARERAFGVLAVSAPGAPLLSHVPFVISQDGAALDLHLVRSNPIVRALTAPLPLPSRVAVSGPDGYVSPDWYGIRDQVPTWNYVAVHLSGMLEMRPQEELRGLLERQSALLEDRLLPKPPWAVKKTDARALERMMRMIVPCRMRLSGVAGTWKLSQNKPEAVRLRAADHLAGCGIGSQTDRLALLMRGA